MKSFLIMAIGLSLVYSNAKAQKKVGNAGFNSILKLMLRHNVKEISVPEAAIKKNAVFLDTREKNEFNVSHIKNGLYVGHDDFNLTSVKNIPKGSEIIVYCSIGKRSEKIAQKLIKAGYTNVSNLYGGIFEWVNQENSVVDVNNKHTKKVHVFGRFWGQWLEKGEKVYN